MGLIIIRIIKGRRRAIFVDGQSELLKLLYELEVNSPYGVSLCEQIKQRTYSRRDLF